MPFLRHHGRLVLAEWLCSITCFRFCCAVGGHVPSICKPCPGTAAAARGSDDHRTLPAARSPATASLKWVALASIPLKNREDAVVYVLLRVGISIDKPGRVAFLGGVRQIFQLAVSRCGWQAFPPLTRPLRRSGVGRGSVQQDKSSLPQHTPPGALTRAVLCVVQLYQRAVPLRRCRHPAAAALGSTLSGSFRVCCGINFDGLSLNRARPFTTYNWPALQYPLLRSIATCKEIEISLNRSFFSTVFRHSYLTFVIHFVSRSGQWRHKPDKTQSDTVLQTWPCGLWGTFGGDNGANATNYSPSCYTMANEYGTLIFMALS